MKQKENIEILSKMPIGKALLKLSLPAAIGMIVMALYNIVDSIFVGRGVGAMAIAGLATVFPIQMIMMALAQTIGIGGASIISLSLGADNKIYAEKIFGNLISMILILSLILTPLTYFFLDEILFLFGARGEIFEYSKDYFKIILWGGPFISFAMVVNSTTRAEGNANVAMITMLISSLINLILDPIFIFLFKWGMEGAAWATVISQISAAIYLAYYYLTGKSVLKFHKKYLRLDKKIVGETLALGASSLARQLSSSIMIAVLNHGLVIYGGEIAVAVFGTIYRLLMIVLMPILGVLQGFTPIVGYNYGAENYKRVREVISVANRATTVIGIVGMLVMLLFSKQLIGIFSTDAELISGGSIALWYFAVTLPIIGFQIIGSGYYQAVGKALPSLFLSLARQVFFLIPLVVILPLFWGLNGIWISFPLADLLAAIVTFFMMNKSLNKLKIKINDTVKIVAE